jgi:hypothetical protein
MEDLTDIRNRTRSKKEAGRNLHSWAFYQQIQIEMVSDSNVKSVKQKQYLG